VGEALLFLAADFVAVDFFADITSDCRGAVIVVLAVRAKYEAQKRPE
jgi:hypothetical protein